MIEAEQKQKQELISEAESIRKELETKEK